MTARQAFQGQVNVQPAPAVAGDFASTNPRFVLDAGPGGMVAGSAGVTVGTFVWTSSSGIDPNGAPTIVNNFGSGPVAGIIHREQQALNTTYLLEAAMTIPGGFPVTVYTGGDFWLPNSGSAQALPGQKAYAAFATGKVTFAATGNPSTGLLNGTIGPGTTTFVGSISGNVLTVTGSVVGTIQIGGTLSGGTGIGAGTQIISQLTGSTGGTGTYALNIPEQTVSAASLTETYAVLTVGTLTSGTLGVGVTLSGGTLTGVTGGAILYVTALGTGTGGVGTYILNTSQTQGNQQLTFAMNVETKWIAMSSGLTNELVKCSDHALG